MEIPDQLQSLFSAPIEEHGDSYVVEIPEREIRHGELAQGGTYRVALLPVPADGTSDEGATTKDREREPGLPEPPLVEGERREVDIEDIGEQGDGIARVERGFVVIVPDTEQGERVTVEITDVQQNVAFAEVTARQTHF